MLVKSRWETSIECLMPTNACRVLGGILLLCTASGAACFAEESVAKPGVEVVVKEMRLAIIPGAFLQSTSLPGQLELEVAVTNRTSAVVNLTADVFECSLDSQPAASNPAIPEALFSGQPKLAPGETTEGWLAFVVRQSLSNEPEMMLSWTIDGANSSISLNQFLRTSTKLEIKRVGPKQTLAVITLHRQLDHLSIWLLNGEFSKLRRQGVERVAVECKPQEGARAIPAVYTNSSAGPVMAWLASATANAQGLQVAPREGAPVSPVKFREIYVVGATRPTRTTRYLTPRSDLSFHQPSREQAILLALGSAYEDVPVDEALSDLLSPEAGVRRCVLESVLDRLSAKQLNDVLLNAKSQDTDYQVLVAENLHRVALPEASAALNEMARSSTPEVSNAATNSLVQSVSPLAAEFLQQVWHEHADDVSRRKAIVSAIIQHNAYGQIELLAEFAEQQLSRFTGAASGDQQTDSSAEPRLRSTTYSSDAAILKSILTFFRAQGNLNFEEAARRELLDILDPKVQDMVLDFVLASDQSDASQLAGQYIELRLQVSPPEGLSAAEIIVLEKHNALPSTLSFTTTLLKTIRKYPNPKYAPALLEFANAKTGSSTYRSDAFRTAVRCASEDVIQQMIDGFDGLDPSRKTVLLSQLALMQHPEAMGLIESCLKSERTQKIAVNVLRNDSSPEAMQIVVRRLDELRSEVETAYAKMARPERSVDSSIKSSGAAMLTPADRSIVELMGLLVGTSRRYIHPDARRVMNQLRRSPVQSVADRAAQSIRQSAYTIPSTLLKKISAAYELQEDGDYVASKDAFLEIVEQDPFYVHAYTALASLDLRDGLGQQAMERLRIADRMNPEDIHTQSMVALAEIRIGNISGGIELAEKILESVPDLSTSLRCDTLYNTACTYGRAIEVEKSPKRLQEYRARGMALLKDCVERKNGFHDSAHILADPDLNVFHEEGEWPELMKTIKENEARADRDDN